MVFQFQNVILFNKIGLKATEFWFFQKLATQHYHQVTVGLKIAHVADHDARLVKVYHSHKLYRNVSSH